MADFHVRNEGNIFLLTPLTKEAHDWVDENIDPEHFAVGNSVVIEHRYIVEIVNGAIAAGFIVQGT